MKNIIIIGAGPRGLAIALQLAYYQKYNNYNCYIIDPNPINTWTYPNIIENITMRSPISFDLTTYIEELQEFSLSKFLGYSLPFSDNQQTIEECKISLNRTQFLFYLNNISKYIEAAGIKTKIIREKVISIRTNVVRTIGGRYEADKIIVALGNRGEYKIPNWVKKTDLRNKLIPLQNIIKNKPINKTISVIGSGQGAAEIVYSLALDNKIYWCTNQSIRVSQYPAPSYTEWGIKSALGFYYSTLPVEKKLDYLKQVKEWQPSITPYINSLLELPQIKQNITVINPRDTTDLQEVFDNSDYAILATGEEIDLNNFPFDITLERDINNNSFPKLEKGFKSVSHPHISFTGSIAALYDGPRQNSIISSSITAKEILDNL